MARWNTAAIFGVGLIGGSIGKCLLRRGLADEVIGIGRNPGRLAEAVNCDAISRWTTDIEAGVRDAKIVVVCTPVRQLPQHLADVIRKSGEATLVTDAGSTKEKLIAEVQRLTPSDRFVGSHPLAGSDKSGVEHSDAELFVERAVIVTPTADTPAAAVDDVTDFWESLGAGVVCMSPAEHDRRVAVTSHLPHVLAALLAAQTPEEYLPLVAGGWLDTTRISAADTELWTQILQENSANVAAAVHQCRAELERWETALLENDQIALTRLLAAGKQRRDAVGN